MELSWLCLLLCLVPALTLEVRERSMHPKILHRHRRYNEECSNKTIQLVTPTDIEDNVPGEHYLDNSDCFWTITAPKDNRIILISSDFELEESYNCRYDFVEIFDGSLRPSASVGKFCGLKNVHFISQTNKLIIHFRSDSSVTATGFRIELAPLPASSNATCNRTSDAESGTLLSLNYPHRYPHNVTCLYNIQAPDNKRVKLNFKDFVLERGPCIDDYLTVYDGKSSASCELGTFCGREAPKSITSSSSSMLLYFHTNDFVREKGFKLTYELVDDSLGGANVEPGDLPPEYDPDCSATLTREAMNLTSPRFTGEDFYLQRKRCRTNIIPPEGHGVVLRFQTFDLEKSLDCIYDHLNVTYKVKQGGITTSRLCGYQRQNTLCFLSWESNMTLDFKSDVLFEGSGYKADYSFIAPNESSNTPCDTQSCGDDCQGYCYNNGAGFHCACPTGKVPPKCVQNITWQHPLEENITRYEGSKITLSCKVNHPHTITVWNSNEFMLPNATKKHISVLGSELKIDEAGVDDSGRYTCTVHAGDWLRSQTVTLIIKPEEENCGKASSKILNPNINAAFGTIAGTNGTKAPDIVPWQVHLWDKSKESHHCGGVLISESHVLTAAHCVEGPKAADFNHNNIRVSVGTLSCNHADAEVRNVARFMTHPNYRNDSLKYDFALLELDRPVVNKSDEIYPICMPTSPRLWNDIPVGYKGLISGCGKDSKGKSPPIMHMVPVPIVKRSVCRSHQLKNHRKFTDDMFCAGYKKGNIGDACAGDSGGPFVAKINGRWNLLGLISFGRACAEEGGYGYYANVSWALPWIREYAPVCGRTRFVRGNYESGKILYVEKALPMQFPWQAAILVNGKIRCCATLISNKWAVTAKHCLMYYTRSERRRIKLVIGDLTPTSESDRHLKRRVLTIENMLIKESTQNVRSPDFALLRLKSTKPVDFNDYVQPVCLPSQDELMPVGEHGWIAGWGIQNKVDPDLSLHLVYATMTKGNNTFCKAAWVNHRLPSDLHCFVGEKRSIQATPGDVGTGLVWEHRGRHVLSAIHSRGNFLQLPGLFEDVHALVPWIKSQMGWTENEV